jgi:hypothetical protein
VVPPTSPCGTQTTCYTAPCGNRTQAMPSKQTQQYERFQAHPGGFTWNGRSFRFDQIRHVFFSSMKDLDDETEAATLVLTLESGDRIPLSFEGLASYFSRHIANLRHLHAYLSYQSFQHRLERYLGELRHAGFFTYERCRFYPRTKIVFGNKEIPVRTTRLRKGHGFVELRKRDRTIFDTLKHRLHFAPFPRFRTETDTDVIFHLLDKLFGQRWKR